MANKVPLHLTIDSELLDYAKKIRFESKKSLSEEFEEWLRIRINRTDTDEIRDYKLEIAKRQEEIKLIQAEAELKEQIKTQEEQRIKIIDAIIDGQSSISLMDRWKGLQALLKDRLHEYLTDNQAQELLNKRIKERGL